MQSFGHYVHQLEPTTEDLGTETCAFNPSSKVLTVAGQRGYVHLVDWKSGAG